MTSHRAVCHDILYFSVRVLGAEAQEVEETKKSGSRVIPPFARRHVNVPPPQAILQPFEDTKSVSPTVYFAVIHQHAFPAFCCNIKWCVAHVRSCLPFDFAEKRKGFGNRFSRLVKALARSSLRVSDLHENSLEC